jgi:ParB-like chromosome segregation protein Spo0J
MSLPTITIEGKSFELLFKDLFRPHTPEEYASMKADIAANGILRPVTLNPEGQVIDGQHRLMIAAELGIPYENIRFHTLPLLTIEECAHAANSLQLEGRQLTAEERLTAMHKRNDRIREDVANGKSKRASAVANGVSEFTARKALKSAAALPIAPAPSPPVPAKLEGLDGKLYPSTKPDPEVLEERAERVAEAKAKGATVDQIAEEEQVSPRTVKSDLKKAKEKKAPRGMINGAKPRALCPPPVRPSSWGDSYEKKLHEALMLAGRSLAEIQRGSDLDYSVFPDDQTLYSLVATMESIACKLSLLAARGRQYYDAKQVADKAEKRTKLI